MISIIRASTRGIHTLVYDKLYQFEAKWFFFFFTFAVQFLTYNNHNELKLMLFNGICNISIRFCPGV